MRKRPRPYNRQLYAERHLVEKFFSHLKRHRIIAGCDDKTAVDFLGSVHLACALMSTN